MTEQHNIHIELDNFEQNLDDEDLQNLYIFLDSGTFREPTPIVCNDMDWDSTTTLNIRNIIYDSRNSPVIDTCVLLNEEITYWTLPTTPPLLSVSRFATTAISLHYFIYNRQIDRRYIIYPLVNNIVFFLQENFNRIVTLRTLTCNHKKIEYNYYINCLLSIMLDILHFPEFNEMHIPVSTTIINNIIHSIQLSNGRFTVKDMEWFKRKIETSLNRVGRFLLYNLQNEVTLFHILDQLLHIEAVTIRIGFYNNHLEVNRETHIRERYRVFTQRYIPVELTTNGANKMQRNDIEMLVNEYQPRFLRSIQSLKNI